MKLALIVPGGFGGREDVIPVLPALTEDLASRHDVHVFAISSPGVDGNYMLGGAHVHLLPLPSLIDIPRRVRRALVLGRLGWQLAREINRTASPVPFDLFHAFWANEPGLLGGLLGRAMRVPVVLTVGGGEAVWLPEIGYGGAGTAFGRALGGLAFRLADEITVGTDFARSFLEGSPAAHARVIPLGIPWRQFDATPLRAPGPPWRLLHVANLNLVKDQKTLLTALVEVVARLGDVSLDCVGEDALGGEVQAQALSLGLGARVRFHGFLPPDQVVPFYRHAHLHVLSSRYESQGVVVLEAAAAGLPTVGTAVGLLPTLSPDAACCVRPGDAQGLATAICSLLTDEPRRQGMGATAQAFARAHDVAWTARAFEQTYEALG